MTIKKFSPNDIRANEVIRVKKANGDLQKMVFLHHIQFGVDSTENNKITTFNDIYTGTTVMIGRGEGVVVINPVTLDHSLDIPENVNVLLAGPFSVSLGSILVIGSGSTVKIV